MNTNTLLETAVRKPLINVKKLLTDVREPLTDVGESLTKVRKFLTAVKPPLKILPYKKPDAIKELESLAYKNHYKNSTLPHQYRSKFHFRDDTANGLTKCIIAYLKLKSAFVSRLNTTGIYRADLKQFVPNTQKRGLGDIFAMYKGASIQVEVKIGRDRMSAAQQKIKAEFEQSGGYYFIAKNFESFKQWFDSVSSCR